LWAACARYGPFRRWQLGFFEVGRAGHRRLLGRSAMRRGCRRIERAGS
jgi:hypothetical protein